MPKSSLYTRSWTWTWSPEPMPVVCSITGTHSRIQMHPWIPRNQVTAFCRFWHLQDILKMLCRKTLILFWTTYSGMVLLWEVYWKYFWKFCLLLRHSSSPEKNRWRVPTGHFPCCLLGGGDVHPYSERSHTAGKCMGFWALTERESPHRQIQA